MNQLACISFPLIWLLAVTGGQCLSFFRPLAIASSSSNSSASNASQAFSALGETRFGSGGYPFRVSSYPAPVACPTGQYQCTRSQSLGFGYPVYASSPYSATGYSQVPTNDTLKCIPYEKVCDGIKDCPDRDDESEIICNCHQEVGHYRCKGQKVKCIPKEWKCDGVADCKWGDDENEANCAEQIHACLGSEGSNSTVYGYGYPLPLNGRRTYRSSWKCDGEQDCPKGEDEKFCTPAYPAAKCKENQHRCKESSTCIEMSALCDQVKDCPQGDDELACQRENSIR